MFFELNAMKTSYSAGRATALAAAAVASLGLSAPFSAWADDSAATSLNTLPATVVTAGRFKEEAARQTQGVSVITAQEIAQSGARSVQDALQRVLGLLPMKQDLSGTGSAGIDLRGYGESAWSNQVVVIDGLRMNEGDLSSPQLANVPIDSIERIEVVRGAASVLYGEGASAGAIIITTKAGAGVARKTGGSISVGAGSKKRREIAANATFAGDNGFSMDVSAQKDKADKHRQNFDNDNEVARLGAQWSNDWLRVGAHIGHDKKETGLPGALDADQYRDNPWQSNTPNNRVKQSNDNHGLFAQAMLGSWELAGDINWRDKASRSVSAWGSYDFDLDARNSSLRARHQHKGEGFGNSLIVGYDESRWQRDILGAFGSRAVAKNKGFYIKDELSLNDNSTQLSAGWRREKANKTESGSASTFKQNVDAWELGLAQSLSSDWTAYARAAKALRMANVDEFSFTIPNTALLPQTSKDLEAGLRWHTEASKLELRAYRSRANNEIGYDGTADGPYGPGTGANVNLDPTKRSGLELDSSHKLSQEWTLLANAALRKAKFRGGANAGNNVPLVAKQTLSLGANWQPTAEHSVNARANWVGKQDIGLNNACRVPSYTTLDVGYRFQRNGWELNTHVQNLGDKKYFSTAFGCTATGQATSIYPEAGRSLQVNLGYRF